eukprot:scaffold142780_cov38-Cyclotella_meneghiniana.AAC.2
MLPAGSNPQDPKEPSASCVTDRREVLFTIGGMGNNVLQGARQSRDDAMVPPGRCSTAGKAPGDTKKAEGASRVTEKTPSVAPPTAECKNCRPFTDHPEGACQDESEPLIRKGTEQLAQRSVRAAEGSVSQSQNTIESRLSCLKRVLNDTDGRLSKVLKAVAKDECPKQIDLTVKPNERATGTHKDGTTPHTEHAPKRGRVRDMDPFRTPLRDTGSSTTDTLPELAVEGLARM